ncbi:hypothetical protein NHG23_08450 [Aerococcaceae bacterium NML190073]|nr:hypothetical protein [Aerococcaceae bacterium NML190073]
MQLNFLKIHHSVPLVGYPKDCGDLVSKSERSMTDILKRFRAFVKKRPNYFRKLALQPVIEDDGAKTQYNLICFYHYYCNRKLLDAGSRSIKLEDELEGLILQFSIASQRLIKEEKKEVA